MFVSTLLLTLVSRHRPNIADVYATTHAQFRCCFHTYHRVKLPNRRNVKTVEDKVSANILRQFHPAFAAANHPMQVVGDGNCLYRAVSQALTGSQNFHVLLRLMTAIELITFKYLYDANSSQRNLSLFGDVRVVTSPFAKLLHDCVHLKCYSELAHIYAISNAIGEPIRSYYPPQAVPEISSDAYNKIVHCRDHRKQPSICIMWTQMKKPIDFKSFRPNHFVNLVADEQIPTQVIDLGSDHSNISGSLNFPKQNGLTRLRCKK